MTIATKRAGAAEVGVRENEKSLQLYLQLGWLVVQKFSGHYKIKRESKVRRRTVQIGGDDK